MKASNLSFIRIRKYTLKRKNSTINQISGLSTSSPSHSVKMNLRLKLNRWFLTRVAHCIKPIQNSLGNWWLLLKRSKDSPTAFKSVWSSAIALKNSLMLFLTWALIWAMANRFPSAEIPMLSIKVSRMETNVHSFSKKLQMIGACSSWDFPSSESTTPYSTMITTG